MEIQVDGHRPTTSFRACVKHAFPRRFRRPTHQEVVPEVTSRSYLPGDVWPRFVSGHVRRTVPSASGGERQHKADGEGGSTGRASVLLRSRRRVHGAQDTASGLWLIDAEGVRYPTNMP